MVLAANLMATGTIHFEYDPSHDVVICRPRWHIETEEDCKVWYEQYASYFKEHGRRADMILLLDDFKLGPGVGACWGKYRGKVHQNFMRYSIRIDSTPKVATYAATSAVLHSIPSDAAATLEEAHEQLRLFRAE